MNPKKTICPRCGVRAKEPGHSYCPECCREYQAELRRNRKADAPKLCRKCSKNLRAPGKTWCRECLSEAKAQYRFRMKRRELIKKERQTLLADAAACREILAKMREERKK